MKLRLPFLLLLSFALAACNFSLAEDITPPPGYQPPTAAPTPGALFPVAAPNAAAGAEIYAEKCAACHGEQGMGDGAQAAQLPVNVPPLGVAEIARKASPAQWFTIVTQGNLQNFMPGFTSLNDQQRWDVVAYAYTLSLNPAQGEALYQANCAQCHGADGANLPNANLRDQQTMSALSQQQVANFIQNGIPPQMPASGLGEEEAFALAAYVRTFTLAPASVPTPKPEQATPTGEAEPTPGTEPSPVAESATEAPTPALSGVAFNGTVSNLSSGILPGGLTVTLRAFDHDMTSGSFAEAFHQESKVEADGAFRFTGIEPVAGQLYIAEVSYQTVPYQTEPLTVEEGQTELTFPTLSIFETTTDTAALEMQQIHFFFDTPANGQVPVSVVYVFANGSPQSILVETDGTTIPFITVPEGAQNVSYEDAGMGGQFLPAETGFVIAPSMQQYGIVALFTLPYEKEIKVKQDFLLNVTSGTIIVPEGMKAEGEGLTAGELRPMGENGNFQTFTFATANRQIGFSVSGAPQNADSAATGQVDSTQAIIIGVGALGFALLGLGVVLFLRDRRRAAAEEEDEEESEEEEPVADEEEILDAIIALDDQFRAGKIKQEAYQARRAALKAKLLKQ